ncbi:MAG: AraC family transcriptional regulator [Bacteroidota bacterium]
MELRNKLYALDHLELLSMKAQPQAFPEHYHETFCISLIRSGMETIKMNGIEIFCPAGSISLNNPFEIHSNPIIHNAQELSFDTLYVSQELMDYIVEEVQVFFSKRIYTHPILVGLFDQTSRSIKENHSLPDIESSLTSFLRKLWENSNQDQSLHPTQSLDDWTELFSFINSSLDQKLNLVSLASIVNMDKYHFARSFRRRMGMSPMNYVLTKKVFAAKKVIEEDIPLGDIAFDFGFNDLPHFSNTFKKYIGVSPSVYRKSKGQSLLYYSNKG